MRNSSTLLVNLMGLCGSGKTSVAKLLSASLVSIDELGGDYDQARRNISRLLATGNVVFESSGLSQKTVKTVRRFPVRADIILTCGQATREQRIGDNRYISRFPFDRLLADKSVADIQANFPLAAMLDNSGSPEACATQIQKISANITKPLGFYPKLYT